MSSSSSSSAPAAKKPTTYFSNGKALSSPPFSARMSRFYDAAVIFIGLYLWTLFATNSTEAAQSSPFAVRNQPSGKRPSFFSALGSLKPGGGGSGGGGGGGSGGGRGPWGGGGGAGGSSGKKLGTVDDVRGPECKSCQ